MDGANSWNCRVEDYVGGDKEMGETMKMIEGLSGRMLVGWFLILWGVTFFFSGVWGLMGLSDYSIGYLIIEVLWDLADIAIAGILALLGLKVLRGELFSAQLPAK
jgi:hypothetical protein